MPNKRFLFVEKKNVYTELIKVKYKRKYIFSINTESRTFRTISRPTADMSFEIKTFKIRMKEESCVLAYLQCTNSLYSTPTKQQALEGRASCRELAERIDTPLMPVQYKAGAISRLA